MLSKVRWAVPFSGALVGPRDSLLHLHLNQSIEGATIEAALATLADGEFDDNDAVEDESHVQLVEAINFTASLDSSHRLQQVGVFELRQALFQFIYRQTNLVLRAIRVFGLSPLVREIQASIQESERRLLLWSTEVLMEGSDWAPVVSLPEDPDALEEKIVEYVLGSSEVPIIRVARWPAVQEGLESGAEPEPEDQLMLNAVETNHKGDLKQSLLEAVTALDIATTKFLNAYFSRELKWAHGRVRDLLRPQLGLTSRVSGLLGLIVPQNEFSESAMKTVLTTIKWRNKVVHELGNLPSGISKEQLREGIEATLDLCTYLGHRTRAITGDRSPFDHL